MATQSKLWKIYVKGMIKNHKFRPVIVVARTKQRALDLAWEEMSNTGLSIVKINPASEELIVG